MTLDDTDFAAWQKGNRQGEPPELIFIPHLNDLKHKIDSKDIAETNAKLDEIWEKYPRFGKYSKPEINKPQDLLGEDHALVVT